MNLRSINIVENIFGMEKIDSLCILVILLVVEILKSENILRTLLKNAVYGVFCSFNEFKRSITCTDGSEN